MRTGLTQETGARGRVVHLSPPGQVHTHTQKTPVLQSHTHTTHAAQWPHMPTNMEFREYIDPSRTADFRRTEDHRRSDFSRRRIVFVYTVYRYIDRVGI